MRRISQKKVLAAIVLLLSVLIVRPAGYNKPALKAPPAYEDYAGKNYTARVNCVVDGDTIVLDTGERVRYIGIDTPEIAHHHKSAEYYGKEANEFNKKLALGKNIRLEFDEERFDKYGRTLAYVYLEDGTFVNAELVKSGYARTMSIKPNTKYTSLFKELQNEAKIKRKGMWAR